VKEQDETPDPENDGGIMRALFDMEQGIERSPTTFRVVLRELLDRIIEKRLEYYLPLEDEEEDEEVPYRTFPVENE
jgi:hypothetical protein